MTKGENKLRYKHVIFDADDTLLRYRDDERAAFHRLFLSLGVNADEDLLSCCNAVSEKIWTETGLYDVHSPAIQKRYHYLYKEHIERVFEEIFRYCKERGIVFSKRISPENARDSFLRELETGGNYVDGAKETLLYLKNRGYILSVATNGLTAIQEGRTKEVQNLFVHLFVSEAFGAIKPSEAFFAKLLSALHAKKEECLFVGDSLSSDICGAKNAGIDCCFFNPQKKSVPENVPAPDFTIEKLTDLMRLL